MGEGEASRTAVISSRTVFALPTRLVPAARAASTPARTLAAVSPGSRPRRLRSSRTMSSSNAPAARVP